MSERCEICQCPRCGSEVCWADVDAGNEYVEHLNSENKALSARIEVLELALSNVAEAMRLGMASLKASGL